MTSFFHPTNSFPIHTYSKREEEDHLQDHDWRIGMIGLGHMGSAVAETLLASGFALTGYDIDDSAVNRLREKGMKGASGIREAVKGANVIFTSLPNSQTVRDVFLSPEGIAAHVEPGAVVVELSTVSPGVIHESEAQLNFRGAKLLDSPISGSPGEARQGKLTLLVGGSESDLQRVRPVLNTFADNIMHVGRAADAKTIKIINNMMTMGNVLVAAEAFAVGIKAGIDPDTLFSALSESGGRSHHFCKRFPNALKRNFNPGFTVELGEKDLSLAMELAQSLNVPTPAAGLIRQLYHVAMAEGLSKEDIVAVLKLYEKWGGVEAKSENARHAGDG
jgi:3-hydroxyisobutyrate dehydrogenase